MKNIEVEVLGVEPPCQRCKKTLENTINAASKVYNRTGKIVNVNKLDITSKNIIEKYGVVMSPAIAVDGVIISMGKIPTVEVIEQMIEKRIEED